MFFKKKKKKEIFPGEGKTLYLVDRVMKSNYNEVNDSSAPGIERCFPCMENTFVSIYRAMKRSIKGEGGLLSMIIIGAIVAPLCRLRYGEITCSNNRWFWKRQLIEEDCNLCPSNAPPLLSSYLSLWKRKRATGKINNQISDNSLSSDPVFLDRKMSDRSFEDLEDLPTSKIIKKIWCIYERKWWKNKWIRDR